MEDKRLIPLRGDMEFPLCLSGGADGADAQWGMCAGLIGHRVIHWSFANHRSSVPDSELVRLTAEQLADALPSVKKAAKSLNKHPPQKETVRNLIYRNYFQVAWTESLYAVATLKHGLCQGGTAWAVQMYLDRMKEEGKTPTLFLFDQELSHWFSHDGIQYNAVDADQVPEPTGIWTGIGTRDLTPEGKLAIRTLMRFVKPLDIA